MAQDVYSQLERVLEQLETACKEMKAFEVPARAQAVSFPQFGTRTRNNQSQWNEAIRISLPGIRVAADSALRTIGDLRKAMAVDEHFILFPPRMLPKTHRLIRTLIDSIGKLKLSWTAVVSVSNPTGAIQSLVAAHLAALEKIEDEIARLSLPPNQPTTTNVNLSDPKRILSANTHTIERVRHAASLEETPQWVPMLYAGLAVASKNNTNANKLLTELPALAHVTRTQVNRATADTINANGVITNANKKRATERFRKKIETPFTAVERELARSNRNRPANLTKEQGARYTIAAAVVDVVRATPEANLGALKPSEVLQRALQALRHRRRA